MTDRRSWGSLSTLWGAVAALSLVLLGLAGCVFQTPTPHLVPQEPREPTALEWPDAAKNAAQADGTFVGTITEMKDDWTYDDPCGLLATALKRCEGTVTYRVKLADGQTTHYVWAFVSPYGDFGLHVNERGLFLWHKTVAYRYLDCRATQAMSSAYCSYDLLNAF